jgi:hypothetical protein
MSDVVFAIGFDRTALVTLSNEESEALARFLEHSRNAREVELCDKIRRNLRIGHEIELHRHELVAIAHLFAESPELLDDSVFAGFRRLQAAVVEALSE